MAATKRILTKDETGEVVSQARRIVKIKRKDGGQ
jgi:hypothetical protein